MPTRMDLPIAMELTGSADSPSLWENLAASFIFLIIMMLLSSGWFLWRRRRLLNLFQGLAEAGAYDLSVEAADCSERSSGVWWYVPQLHRTGGHRG
jgi:hypothetical protein